jgi:hypothetical protein
MCGSKTRLIPASNTGTSGLSCVYRLTSIPNVVKSGDGSGALIVGDDVFDLSLVLLDEVVFV